MPSTIFTTNQSTLENQPVRAQHIWRMSDGSLVAVAFMDGTGGETPGWQRWRSADGGVTWVAMPIATTTRFGLYVAQDGDVIYGMSIDAFGADIIKWVYAAGAFTDTKGTYTPTNSWNQWNNKIGGAVADTVRSSAHIMFGASPDGGTTDYIYLVAIDKAGATKEDETRFVISDTGTPGQVGSLRVNGDANPKIFLVYLNSDYTNGLYRSFTFNGSTYSAADAEETAFDSGVATTDLECALNASGQLDIFWTNTDGAIQMRTRTGVGAYSSIVVLAANGNAWNTGGGLLLAISETNNATADLTVVFTHNSGAAWNIKYIKRVLGTWTAITSLTTDGLSVEATVSRKIGSDSKTHLFFIKGTPGPGAFPVTVPAYTTYDSVGLAANPTATNVTPTGTANTDATPDITAKYGQALANDKLGKYLVVVYRPADGVQFWSTSSIANPAGTHTAVAGAAGVPNGTYRTQVTFVTASGETAGGPEVVVVVASQRISWASIPLGPAGTTARRLYRTLAGGATGTEKLVTTINDNTTTTFDDNVADGSLGVAIPKINRADGTAYTGADVMPGGTFSITYAGTALAIDTAYNTEVRFWDSVDSKWSVFSTPVTFSWTDPVQAAAVAIASDATKAKNRLAAYTLYPLSVTEWAPLYYDFLRRVSGQTLWEAIKSRVQVIVATVNTGFSAYRQLPEKVGRNLVVNGGFMAGSHGWNLVGAGIDALVADSASPTGYAVRKVMTAGFQNTTQILPVEGGKTYSFSALGRSDGTASAFLVGEWLDAAGVNLGTISSPGTTSLTYVEQALVAAVAPGNARSIRLNITASAAGIVHWTAVRALQQTAGAPAWTAAHQQYMVRGRAIYEAATNLLTNGDIETTLSGTVNAFDDQFADLNAWTLDSGTAFTVAANVVSRGAADGRETFGHPDWWDQSSGSRFRFIWVTGGTVLLYLRWIDSNNWVRLFTDGATFRITKKINGAANVDVFSGAAALANGTPYWFQWSITGTSYSATLDNDAAGAPGTNVQSSGAQTISDAAVQTALMAVELLGAGMQFGGAFADVCLVKIPAAPNWVVDPQGGVPAFAVSKVHKFAGTYSLSIRNNHNGATGRWINSIGAVNNTFTWSARVKLVSVVTAGGTGARIEEGFSGSPASGYETGTIDWHTVATTGARNGTAYHGFRLSTSSGTAYMDNAWIAQQAYDTGNSGDGQEYLPTGARTATDLRVALPSGFDLNDFAVTGVSRFDHAYNGHGAVLARYIAEVFTAAANRIPIIVDTNGSLALYKVRSAVVVSVSDAVATAFAAGDTISWAMRFSTTAGLKMWISKNGGAATGYALATPEAKLPITGPAELVLGRYGATVGQELAGTIGVVRVLKAGLSDATIEALVLNPYQQPTDDDLAVWHFEGVGRVVPAVDDETAGPGVTYEYRCDTTTQTPPTVVQTGQSSKGSYATAADQQWLKNPTTPSQNLKLPVRYDAKYPRRKQRAVQLLEPVAGGPKLAIYGQKPFGEEISLTCIWDTSAGAVAARAALDALQAADDDIYLLDFRGGTRKVVFAEAPDYIDHPEGWLEARLSMVETV